MRAALLLAVVLAAALGGGATALVVGHETGWLDRATTTTVVERSSLPPTTAQPSPAATLPEPALSPAKTAGNRFDPARIYAGRSPGVVTIFAFFGASASDAGSSQEGSGFVVSQDGYILTNSHVITNAGRAATVESASRVYVEFKDRDRVPAQVVGWDVFDDVGVLRVDPSAHALVPVPLGDSSRVVVGEAVAAIGSPFGNESSLAVGVVSATQRSIQSLTSEYDVADAIQTDAPLNHGNSGGPLFDAEGRVIGITAQIRSDSGTAEGVGFAVPINSARRSMSQLISTGRVAYAFVGITTQDLTPTVARKLGYAVSRGALVERVQPGSAGAAAGLKGGSRDAVVNGASYRAGGDVVVAIDGHPVSGSADLARVVAEELTPGEVATFTIQRAAHRLRVSVRLGERAAAPASP